MDDLISRKELLAAYDREHVGTPGRARKLIENAPAVDAVPVIPAHSKYCPSCGALMDGKDENHEEKS